MHASDKDSPVFSRKNGAKADVTADTTVLTYDSAYVCMCV